MRRTCISPTLLVLLVAPVACGDSTETGASAPGDTAADAAGDSTTASDVLAETDVDGDVHAAPDGDVHPAPDGAAGDGNDEASGPNPAANVKLSQPEQTIDGFGVSTAWLSPPDVTVRTTVYDALFSVSKGAGLSILRNRIPFRENPKYDDKFIVKNADGTYKFATTANGSKVFALDWGNWDLSNTSSLIASIAAKGADYQVSKFLSTPWTPPNNSVTRWKLSDSNKTIDYVNTPEQGGYLDPAHYADYADVLADYVLGYKAKMAVDLTALSLQNEPNFQANYESADWSAQQFHDFIAVLKTEFAKKGVFAQLPGLSILAPEDPNLREALILPTLQDPNTADVLGIVAAHQYEFGIANESSYTAPVLSASLAAGKRLWMTEWSTAAWATRTDMADALLVAKLIHEDLTITGVSAFFYWWAWSATGNGSLVVLPMPTTVVIPKRLYAMGQYSRFVRPGWRRVVTDPAPTGNVLFSAFEDPAGKQVAVVAINVGTAPATVTFTIDVGRFGSISVYRTSESEDLSPAGTLAGGATVDVTLQPTSVTTLVSAVSP
jgi:O-glycosyl hydrolase